LRQLGARNRLAVRIHRFNNGLKPAIRSIYIFIAPKLLDDLLADAAFMLAGAGDVHIRRAHVFCEVSENGSFDGGVAARDRDDEADRQRNGEKS